MKVVILAGGRGTRLAEETTKLPKPMVEIGGRPLLLHLMGQYAAFGFTDFVIACGYRGEIIKEYFRNLPIHASDYVINLANGSIETLKPPELDWRVGVIDTGMETQTGGRILRLQSLIGNTTFLATYGDGLSTVDIRALVDFHRSHGRLATVTAVHPPARFGALLLDGARVCEFAEKPQAGEGWINGGFFVFEPGVFEYLDDHNPLEHRPLERLAADQQLMAYRHEGFWQPMDTMRDKQHLETLWQSGKAPWSMAPRAAQSASAS